MGVQFKLFIVSFVLIAGSFTVADVFLTSRVQKTMAASIRDDMMVRAQLAARVTGAMYAPMSDTASWTVLANDLARAADARITIVRRDGVVIGDSTVSVDKLRTLESHADRPEFVAAFSQGSGASARFSRTVQMDELYVALPFQRGGAVVGAIRIAKPLSAVVESVDRIRDILLISGALALLMSTIASVFAANWVTTTVAELTKAVRRMVAGDLTARTNVTSKDEIGELGRAIDEFAGVASTTVNQLRNELTVVRGGAPQPR